MWVTIYMLLRLGTILLGGVLYILLLCTCRCVPDPILPGDAGVWHASLPPRAQHRPVQWTQPPTDLGYLPPHERSVSLNVNTVFT